MDDGWRWTGTRGRRRRVPPVAGVVLALALLASGCINGGTWSAAPAPVAPVQVLPTRMADVSCVSVDWCLAVGSMGSYPLAEVWNGSAWSVVTAPSLDGGDNTSASRVDCGSRTTCVAKVTRVLPTPDVLDYVVGWDGARWRELGGAEARSVESFPIDCAPGGTCLIVDNAWERTMYWDGSRVTVIPFTVTEPPGDVNAIDCHASNDCLAAAISSLAHWDGDSWSELPGSDSSEVFGFGAHTLSCTAADDCLAVGYRDATDTEAISATWDGSAWTEVPLPAGVSRFGSLECVGGGQCLLRVVGPEPGATLAWVGGAWVKAPAAPAGSERLSCVPYRCLSVGSVGSPATPTAATYTWTDD